MAVDTPRNMGGWRGIQNSKFKIQNSKFRIQNSKFRIQNSKFPYALLFFGGKISAPRVRKSTMRYIAGPW
jgi:hypothetical protein